MTVIQKYSYLLYWVCDNQKRPKIYRLNPLYLTFIDVNGYFEEINRNKYLTLVPLMKAKKDKKVWRTVD